MHLGSQPYFLPADRHTVGNLDLGMDRHLHGSALCKARLGRYLMGSRSLLQTGKQFPSKGTRRLHTWSQGECEMCPDSDLSRLCASFETCL